MSTPLPSSAHDVTGPAGDLRRICERFAAAWKGTTATSPRPLLETFLVAVDGLDPTFLLAELLAVELTYRRMAGERPDPREYHVRFPALGAAINAAFGRPGQVGEMAGPVPPITPPLLQEPCQDSADLKTIPSGSRSRPLVAAQPLATTLFPLLTGYEILGKLGQGGMGIVYQAIQRGANRIVALKMIKPGVETANDYLARFKTEAEASARLSHPNIVQVFEVGEHDGRPFFSLEFCAGGSLHQKLNGTPLPPREAATLLETLARAVQAAHDQGVLHRDLKPANVLLTADGTPKVSDFGLARKLDELSGPTHTGSVLGTPSYMAPEQATGRTSEVGYRTDVYALGAILYECLTGHPPFKAATVVDTLLMVRLDDPVPPARLQRGVPRDLETICLKCLAKEPGRRYGTATELADDLGRFRRGETVRARRAGPVERLAKWTRRHRALTALYSLSFLVVVGGVGLALWFSATLGEARARVQATAAQHDLEARVAQDHLDVQTARAEAAHQKADLQEFYALIREVEKRAVLKEPAWTWLNQADLRRAASGPAAVEQRVDLRSEAATAFGTLDLRPAGFCAKGLTPDCLAFDPLGRWLAIGQAKAQPLTSCTVRLVPRDGLSKPLVLSFQPVPLWLKIGLVQDGARALAFSRDGRWLVVGTRSGRLHRWDLTQPTPETVSWVGHTGEVVCLAFQPDGAGLVTASRNDRMVKRWPCTDWCRPGWAAKPTEWTAPGSMESVAVHPLDGSVACRTEDFQIHWLSSDTLQTQGPPVAWKKGFRLHFSPDGSGLTSFEEGTVRLDSVEDGLTLWRLRLPDNDRVEDGDLSGLVFSPTGTLLLTASEQTRHAKVWELASGRLIADLLVDGGPVNAAFAPDGRSLALTERDRTLLYEIGGLREQTFTALRHNRIVACALHADGRRLATMETRGSDMVLALDGTDTLSSAPPACRRFSGHLGRRHLALCFHPQSTALAYADVGRLVLFPPHADGAIVPLQALETYLSFGPDGRLWGTVAEAVCVWDDQGKELARWSNALDARLTGLGNLYAVSVGQTRTAVCGRDGRLRLFDAATVRVLWSRWVANAPLGSVALSPDETWAAVGSERGDLRLLSTRDGATTTALTPQRDWVTALSWSGEHLLASGSRDRTVKLWRCEDGVLTELITLRQPAPVRWLGFHPDGVRLYVLLEGERAVRIWHLDRLRDRLTETGLGADLEIVQPRALPPSEP
jgi:WD40 repeat protein